MKSCRNQLGFTQVEILLVTLVFVLIGAIGYLVFDRQKTKSNTNKSSISSYEECVAAGNPSMESYPPQCSANGKTFTQGVKDSVKDTTSNPLTTRVTSGGKTFSVLIPDGWKIVKDKTSDFFLIGGKTQPKISAGTKPQIEEVEGFGGDGPSVFAIFTEEQSVDYKPNGTATAFNLGKAETLLQGTKYTYVYDKDDSGEGIGSGRLKGDRDYQYVIKLKNGKQIRAWYNVYASDPVNNVDVIESMLQSISVN